MCVQHFFSAKIKSFGCWMSTLHRLHYCDPAPKGVSTYDKQSLNKTLLHEPTWLKAKPSEAEVKAFWEPKPATQRPTPVATEQPASVHLLHLTHKRSTSSEAKLAATNAPMPTL